MKVVYNLCASESEVISLDIYFRKSYLANIYFLLLPVGIGKCLHRSVWLCQLPTLVVLVSSSL